MKPVRTWILVADGSRARLLESMGPGKGIHQIPHTDESWLLPPNREIFTDRPGRSFESHGAARHALESPSDPHRDLKRQFAAHLLSALDQRKRDGHFDRLVLIAPPQFLGDLRAALPSALARCIVGELAQDLTHVATDEIGAHLADTLVT